MKWGMMADVFNGGIPLFERLLIESHSNCNRSCWFCPRTYDKSGKYLDDQGLSVLRQMPTDKILNILDQAQAMRFRGKVGFHHYSEPLLDRRNPMLAREAKARGMVPYLHTNGDVLKFNDELCAQIKEIYGTIVVGLYDYGSNEELQDTKSYWYARLEGVVDLKFSMIGVAGSRAAESMGVPKALVPTDKRMSIPDLTYDNAPCHRPLIRMIIQYDGEMCNCCEDTYGSFQLGNVYASSLEELWHSERHRRFTEELIRGQRGRHELCRKCPMSPSGWAIQGQKIQITPRRYKPNES
jgi:2-deoxy-scyllo-inosamine dehydrogenase (SAM-dependent)/8-amino-3,8-dideoxy-alpha-D-manno-octulosonate transaminase